MAGYAKCITLVPETSFTLPYSLYLLEFCMAKTSAVVIRFNEDEKDALRDLAQSYGISVSELMRRLAREAVSVGPSFFPEERKALAAATRQLSALGRNINQIARRVNSGQCQADPLSMEQIGQIKAEIANFGGIANRMKANAKERRVILRSAGRAKGL